MVTVPPGHKVLIVKPTEEIGLSTLESGPTVVSFGNGRGARSVLAGAAKFLQSSSEPKSLIWLVTREIVELFVLSVDLFAEAEALIKSSPRGSHLLVFPDDSPERLRLMLRFKEAGCGVHFGGPDRACYVEVHKPGGEIIVGMPGPEFSAEYEAAAHAQPPLSATPLSDLMTMMVSGGATAEVHASFTATLLRSPLGLIASGEDRRSLALVRGPNGKALIKACADPIAFHKKHPDAGINAEMPGRELLEMVVQSAPDGGVLVCSAASLHSMPIDAAMARRMLAEKHD